jgi:uncharacterized protein (TIGR02246 family)
MMSAKKCLLPLVLVALGAALGATLTSRTSWDPLGTNPAAGAQAKSGEDAARAADKAAIGKVRDSFAKALQSGDAKAIAAHWTTEGEYLAEDGTTFRGRDVLQKAYAEFFGKHPDLKVKLEVDSLRFISRDSAIEEGLVTVSKGKNEEPTSSQYSALYVREQGQWLLAVVREWPVAATSLRDLEWLAGTWAAKGEGYEVHATYQWTFDKSFLRVEFTVKEGGRDFAGMQMIGKDPATGLLQSWTFESQGGVGQAAWTRDGKKWLVQATGVEADGRNLSATNILTRIDDDTFTWQSIDRTLDDVDLPDLPPIKVTRVKDKK